jgi:hypothetical protein
MPTWSYNQSTDTLIVWGGTAETPIALDDIAGEIEQISAVADGSYVVHCNLVIGDGTIATHLASLNELVRFDAGKTLVIKDNATLRLGEEHENWGRNGSAWTIAPSANMDLIATGSTTARFEQYASLMTVAGNKAVLLKAGAWVARNALVSGIYQPGANTACNVGILTGVEIDWMRVQISNLNQLGLAEPVIDLFQDVHIHGLGSLYVSNASISIDTPRITGAVNADLHIFAHTDDRTVKVVDPVHNLGTVTLQRSSGRTATVCEVYTSNLTIVDADGVPIEGVTVKCHDKNNNLIFEEVTRDDTNPDEHGTIEPQEIVYREWTASGSGTSSPDPTTFTPHKFTFERAGFQTVVMPDVMIDSPQSGGLNLRVPMMEPVAGGGGGKVVNLGMQS